MQSKKEVNGVGTLLLMVLFVTLCMSVFAMLALVTTHRDYQLTDKTVTHMENYYEAECRAQALLAQIDSMVATYVEEPLVLEEQLRGLETVQRVVIEEDKGQVCYEVAYEPNQKIVVEVALFLVNTQEKRYQVESYCVVPQDTAFYTPSEPMFGDVVIE